MPECDSVMVGSPGDTATPEPGLVPACCDKLPWGWFLEPLGGSRGWEDVLPQRCFLHLPESWARLLILLGFPHFGNLSGSARSPEKGSGTRDVLSPPGQLRARFLPFPVFPVLPV